MCLTASGGSLVLAWLVHAVLDCSLRCRQLLQEKLTRWLLGVEARLQLQFIIIIIIIIIIIFIYLLVPSVVKIPKVKNIKLKSNPEWLTFGVIPIDEGSSESNLIETLY